MPLAWHDQKHIALALLKAYPDADRLALGRDREALTQMILSLPEFQDSFEPPEPACLDHILWAWMRFAHAQEEGEAA